MPNPPRTRCKKLKDKGNPPAAAHCVARHVSHSVHFPLHDHYAASVIASTMDVPWKL